MSCKAIIFDLDGTLVNTLADLGNAMNYALESVGEPVHSLESCRMMIGNGVKTFAKRALSGDKQHLRDKVLGIMNARYRDNCFENSNLYDGMAEVVSELSNRGIFLAVITNKDQDAAEKIVEHFFGKGTFEHIIGVRGEDTVKPDPAATENIVKLTGVERKDFLFVGDSDVDIKTAGAVGICSVGAAWGFRSRAELASAGADIVIDKPGEILDLVA